MASKILKGSPAATPDKSVLRPSQGISGVVKSVVKNAEETATCSVTELFSHFTANIIKQDTLFTR